MSASKYSKQEQARLLVLNYDTLNQMNKNLYKEGKSGNFDKFLMFNGKKVFLSDFIISGGPKDRNIDCFVRLKQSRKRQTKRVKARIVEIFVYGGKAYFVTLTFTDEVLNNTSFEERRLIVKDYLESQGISYVMTVDFGSGAFYHSDSGEIRKGTEREHYHAIIDSPIDKNKWLWGEQVYSAEINNNIVDITKVAKYLAGASLFSRAFLEGDTSMVYSRKRPLIRGTPQILNNLVKLFNGIFFIPKNIANIVNKVMTHLNYMFYPVRT